MNVDPPTAAQPAAPVLVNVSIAGCAPFAGLLWQARVLALARWPQRLPHGGAGGVSRMADLVEAWPLLAEPLRALCADPQVRTDIATAGVPVGALRLHAPVKSPQVYCTIGNYRCQLLEAAADLDDGPTGAQAGARQALALGAIEQRLRGGEPYVCLKGSACLAGPHDDLPVPAAHATLDWEVEIGVVIGRRTWQVPVHEALGAVAGYCVVNDITLRERIFRQEPKVMGTDWLQSKAHPGWLPAGPWLVPGWDVPDPAALRLWLRLNGQVMQDGCAADMLFAVAEQIAYLSRHVPLMPGDLVCTGSPAGFGSHHRRFLQPGDVLEAGVTGLGAQRVACI